MSSHVVLTPSQLLTEATNEINKLGKEITCRIGTKNNKAWFMAISTKVEGVEKVLFIHNTTRALGYCNNNNVIVNYIVQHVTKWIEMEYPDMGAVNMHDDTLDHITNYFINKSNQNLPKKARRVIAQKVKILFNKAFEDVTKPHMITDHVIFGLMKYLEPGSCSSAPTPYKSKNGHTVVNHYLDLVDYNKPLNWKVLQELGVNNVKCIPLGIPSEDTENAERVEALRYLDTVAEAYSLDKLSALYLILFVFNYGSPGYIVEQERVRLEKKAERKLMQTPASVDTLIDLQDVFGHVQY